MSPLELAHLAVKRKRRGVLVARAFLYLFGAAKAIRHHAPLCPAIYARPCTCGLAELRRVISECGREEPR